MSKKIVIGVASVVALALIIFAIKAIMVTPTATKTAEGDDKNESFETQTQEEETPVVVKKFDDKDLQKPFEGEKKETFEQYTQRLDNLVETNRKEVEECEASIDRTFSGSVEDDSDALYREDTILDTLEEFDNLPLVPKSSARLLEALASDHIKGFKGDELTNKLKELRPCRPYQKMSFIHNIMINMQKKNWSESTKARAKQSIFKYFEKELSDRTTLSNLNMQAALLQTLVSEGLLSKKHEEKVMDFKDELEDAYDDLLDKADEIKESGEEKGAPADAVPHQIIRQEFNMEPTYRESLVNLINEVKSEN